MAAYCEDYPACGHTPDNPCARQWYDEPGAFDTSRPNNQHALCDHEAGICEVDPPDEDDDPDDTPHPAPAYQSTQYDWDAIQAEADDHADNNDQARLIVLRWNEY